MQNHALSTSIKPSFSAILTNHHSAFFYKVKKRTVLTTKQHALVWFLFLITFCWQANLYQTHGTSDLLAIFIFDAWFQPEVGGRCVNVSMSQSLQQRNFWCSLEGPSNRKHTKNKQNVSWDPHTDDSWPSISTLQPFISKQLASIESPRWELQEGAGHVRGLLVVAVEGPRWKHDQIQQNKCIVVQNSSGTLEMLSASYQFQSMNAWAGRTLYTVTSWHMSQLVCYIKYIPWLHRLRVWNSSIRIHSLTKKTSRITCLSSTSKPL